MNGTLRDFLVQSIYQISKKAKIIIISSCILIVGWLAGWISALEGRPHPLDMTHLYTQIQTRRRAERAEGTGHYINLRGTMIHTTTRPPLMSCSAIYPILHNCCSDERRSYNAPSLSMKGGRRWSRRSPLRQERRGRNNVVVLLGSSSRSI